MHSKDYSNYVNTTPADSGSASVLIPCRVSSLSTTLHLIRPTANMLNPQRRSVTGRCTGGLTQYQYQINGVQVPQIAVPIGTYDPDYPAHCDVAHSLPNLLMSMGCTRECNRSGWG